MKPVGSRKDHILIVRFSAMGDVVMSIHAVSQLRNTYPELKITVATKPKFAGFYEKIPDVEVLTLDREGSFKSLLRLVRAAGDSGVNSVADIHNSLRGKIIRFCLAFRGARTAAFRKNSNVLDGWAGNAVYGSIGVPKLGGANAAGYLETPALDRISGTQDITVTFKAAPFYEWNKKPGTDPADCIDKNVSLDITVSGAGEITEGGVADLSALEPLVWGTYTVKISGATAQTKVRISADHAKSCRFFLDDIVIK